MQTRSEVISRLRNSIKEVTSDSKFTNRYLWNVFWTNSLTLIKQEADRNRLYNQSDIWVSICIKMSKVSPLLCDCLSLPLDCVIYRSRLKLPDMVSGNTGNLYRFIASPDLSQRVVLVTPLEYTLKNTKYNRERYAFIHDGYLWTNTPWPYLVMSYIPVGDVPDEFKCNCEDETENQCGKLLHTDVSLSGWLVQVAITMSLSELGISRQMPVDELPNINTNDKGLNDR